MAKKKIKMPMWVPSWHPAITPLVICTIVAFAFLCYLEMTTV